MPKISTLFNDYLVYIYNEIHSQHNKPHIHVIKGDINISIGLDGEILAGDESKVGGRDMRKIKRWISAHSTELEAAWAAVSSGEHPEPVSNVIPPEQPSTGEMAVPMTESVEKYKDAGEVSVKEVYPLPDTLLLCKFSNGEWVLYDISRWLNYSAFADLERDALFMTVTPVYGNPTWESINEEITAYDIYVDGIQLANAENVEYLKELSNMWKQDRNTAVMKAVVHAYLVCEGLIGRR